MKLEDALKQPEGIVYEVNDENQCININRNVFLETLNYMNKGFYKTIKDSVVETLQNLGEDYDFFNALVDLDPSIAVKLASMYGKLGVNLPALFTGMESFYTTNQKDGNYLYIIWDDVLVACSEEVFEKMLSDGYSFKEIPVKKEVPSMYV